MMKIRKIMALLLVAALTAVFASGCGSDPKEFSYSDGLDEKGYWEKVDAKEHVELCDYIGISIPNGTHKVTAEEMQEEIDKILTDYGTDTKVTDRAIADGDTVNIDYVGSIGGVPFDGGSTNGAGTEVTIGETSYIDDFLEQLIGHKPGESFDIQVTFPTDYGQEDLNGKDAVFAITVNHIIDRELPELNDDFVADNLAYTYSWRTVSEMKKALEETIRTTKMETFLEKYVIDNTTVLSLPDTIVEYQENTKIKYYQDYADSYEMELDEFLSTYLKVADKEAMLEKSRDEITKSATYFLIMQAIAEDSGMSVGLDELAAYFTETTGSADYSKYQESYGLPYLKLIALCQRVMDSMVESAVLE